MTNALILALAMKRHRVIAGAALFGLLVLAFAARAAIEFPSLTGRVVDNANLLSASEELELTQRLEALEGKSTDQLVVVTLPSLQGYEIEEFGYQLGRHWGIGQQGKDNGVLLIVAPNERKIRIEVGRRLEPIMTDGLSKLIIENTILPRFRRGEFGQGILAGVKDIADALLGDAAEVERRAVGGFRDEGIDWVAVIFILIWIGVFAYIIWRAHKAATETRGTGPAADARRPNRRARDRDSDWVIVPGGAGGSGGWSGGSGGGGWSGGGGGFGGGGASGGW